MVAGTFRRLPGWCHREAIRRRQGRRGRPSGAVADQPTGRARRHRDGGFLQRQAHGVAGGMRQSQTGADPTCGAHGAAEIRPAVALLARRDRPGSPLRPERGQAGRSWLRLATTVQEACRARPVGSLRQRERRRCFLRRLGLQVGLGAARPHRDVAEPHRFHTARTTGRGSGAADRAGANAPSPHLDPAPGGPTGRAAAAPPSSISAGRRDGANPNARPGRGR